MYNSYLKLKTKKKTYEDIKGKKKIKYRFTKILIGLNLANITSFF